VLSRLPPKAAAFLRQRGQQRSEAAAAAAAAQPPAAAYAGSATAGSGGGVRPIGRGANRAADAPGRLARTASRPRPAADRPRSVPRRRRRRRGCVSTWTAGRPGWRLRPPLVWRSRMRTFCGVTPSGTHSCAGSYATGAVQSAVQSCEQCSHTVLLSLGRLICFAAWQLVCPSVNALAA